MDVPRRLFRYYMAVLCMLVFGLAIVLYLFGPIAVGIWLVLVDNKPLWAGVLAGVIGSVFTWPLGVWLALDLPKMWRQMAWDTERYVLWRRAHERGNGAGW